MRIRSVITLIIITVAPSIGAESANPFIAGNPSSVPGPALAGALSETLGPLLQGLTQRMVELVSSIESEKSPTAILALVLACFVYGIFHALGPGHGKTIISGFFVARDSKPRHAVVVGFLMSLFHAISALVVVMVLWFAIRGLFTRDFEFVSRLIRIISFTLVATMGGAMLVRRILGKGHGHTHAGTGPRDPNHPPSLKEMAWLALASGIVPCPGASAIVLLSLSLNLVFVSVVAVSAISLGMGVTVSAIGTGVILARRSSVLAAGGKRGHEAGAGRLRKVLEIAGALALLLLGLLLLLSQFL